MADARKLKQDALAAVAAGAFRKAATCYANLERAEPADPTWPFKLGECLRKMDATDEAVRAFARAAAAYAEQDVLLKAIAVCKIILAIDPRHTHTQALLASLHAAQARPGEGALAATPAPAVLPPARVSVPPTPVRAAPAAAAPPVAPPRAPGSPTAAARLGMAVPTVVAQVAPAVAPPPLPQLRLAELVPGSQQAAQIPSVGSRTAMRIAIDESFANAVAPPSRPHRGAGRNTMARFVLPKTPFFSVLTPELFRMAVERVQLIPLAAGETLFHKGDPGNTLYVVAWGEVAVLVPTEVARLSEGDFFGEIALVADRPRTATVRATVDSQVLALDRSLIVDLVSTSPEVLKVLLRFLRERLIATMSETSPVFAPFTALERIGLAARFQFVEIDPGLAMVEQGKKSPGLFVLLSGDADVVTGGRVVSRLDAGDVFGEISLMAGQDAGASVVARSRCFVLFMPRADFTELIMTHPQVLEHISSVAEARQREIGHLRLL